MSIHVDLDEQLVALRAEVKELKAQNAHLLGELTSAELALTVAEPDAELLHELLDHKPPVIFVWEYHNPHSASQFYVTDKDFPPVQGRGAVTERASLLLAKRSKK